MKRIGIPEGMTLTAVICLTRVETEVLESHTELLVEGFTRSVFGDIHAVDILLGESDAMTVIELLRELSDGAMFTVCQEPFSFEGGRIVLRYPTLNRWEGEPFELCLEKEDEMSEPTNALELIARKIANRSKRQRHYFDDDDDVRPSRKVKGLWTYGRETYGLEKVFVYVPAQSELPLDELADLLSRIDGKLERAGSFKRVLCTYGDGADEVRNGQGAFIRGRFKVPADQWRAALIMLTEPGTVSQPLPFTTFRVPYRHAFGAEATTRPRSNDPVIIVAPHRDVQVSEKARKAMRAFRKNLNWVFYEEGEGWSVETSLSWLGDV